MTESGGEVVLDGVPEPVRRVIEELGAAGHPSFLVGGCVRDLLRGASPGDFDVTTPASPKAVLALFPRAVAIGIRHGTVMLPTPGGPIDITTFRGGPSLLDDLAHRDFTLNAMAYDPASGEIIDPFDGRLDLAKGELHAVGSARERFEEDPLRAVRAARIAAVLQLEVDPSVERAMAEAVDALQRVARERIRQELTAMLLASDVGRGLMLLRRTGIEHSIAPAVSADAAEVVAALPVDLELRLAGWLRGARALRVLRQLRFSRVTAERIAHLLSWHPIDAGVDPTRDASVRRQLRRIGEDAAPLLIALRRAELRVGKEGKSPRAAELAARVDAVEAAFQRVQEHGVVALHRQALAIDGQEIMRLLELPPGPQVGRALSHLTECVVDDPAANTPEKLRQLLAVWADTQN